MGETKLRVLLGKITREFGPLDWMAVVTFAIGLGCVALGALPVSTAAQTIGRVLPLLIFLGAVIILAELLAAAQVFDVLAARAARLSGGRHGWLFLLCVALATTVTIFLNLDTTAVLLTPILIATARAIGMNPLPFAMTTVWLANTASLLLPASNLTNLLAMDRIGLSTGTFLLRLAAPQVAAVLVSAGLLWVLYWRPNRPASGRHRLPTRVTARDGRLFWIGLACCGAFVVLVVCDAPLAVAAVIATGVLAAAFLRWRPTTLQWRLLPWRLLAFVTGLFLVVQSVTELWFGPLLSASVGTSDDSLGVLRSAIVGASLSNVINNLPAYIAVEAVVPAANEHQLFALLLGTNIGPLITPWASLATVLWHERCHAAGVTISWQRFMATGAIAAGATLAAAVGIYLAFG